MPKTYTFPVDDAKFQAVQALAALPADDWRRLQELARACTSGHLSFDAWQTASFAIVGDALQTAESDGFVSFGAAV